ncbi:class I SAM-dependent methyltransferase [Salipiger sp. 1_MG-2023]|uniref:class I SAM-dependent methyltransferase n=1 Tax=Salipiger sp. 1_MG-2023 TaxID=3062665 RepID=UPI0026E1C120|nr:class I SAM-dependent methyltransferase [Salipiger sp. 1_MG-2023]MDO6587664.1 class I SAM-dependent methyltransferase [Salipiger sp. 1_MG-2023]
MSAVHLDHLETLYANGDDPWGFRTSAYEQAKFRATRAALGRPAYSSTLELGCGNGELARHIAPICGQYTGVDAVETALQAARRAVPGGHFVQLFLPAPLPGGPHDLIILSEILYFLDPDGIRALAAQIDGRWPGAELLCVIWLGHSGNPLQGRDALDLFRGATSRAWHRAGGGARYRIDRAEGRA